MMISNLLHLLCTDAHVCLFIVILRTNVRTHVSDMWHESFIDNDDNI